MHYSIFPSKTSWISSGSNKVTGETNEDQNFSRDQILEVKKTFYDYKFDYRCIISQQKIFNNLLSVNTLKRCQKVKNDLNTVTSRTGLSINLPLKEKTKYKCKVCAITSWEFL